MPTKLVSFHSSSCDHLMTCRIILFSRTYLIRHENCLVPRKTYFHTSIICRGLDFDSWRMIQVTKRNKRQKKKNIQGERKLNLLFASCRKLRPNPFVILSNVTYRHHHLACAPTRQRKKSSSKVIFHGNVIIVFQNTIIDISQSVDCFPTARRDGNTRKWIVSAFNSSTKAHTELDESINHLLWDAKKRKGGEDDL